MQMQLESYQNIISTFNLEKGEMFSLFMIADYLRKTKFTVRSFSCLLRVKITS
jgi:hypothetical protein